MNGPICGKPMRFYRLNRPRTDGFPVCHRPPHEGDHHLSLAAMERHRAVNRATRHLYDKVTGRRLAA